MNASDQDQREQYDNAQDIMLQRLTNSLNKQYNQVNNDLSQAVAIVERLARKVRVGEPVNRDIDNTLSLLVNAIVESSELQNMVIEMHRDQHGRRRSVKAAYAQGWEERLTDLLDHATPEQAAVIHALLNEPDDDSEISY